MVPTRRALALLLACAFAATARADSWAAPVVTEVFSASRDHFVRVIPGTALGDTVGFAGAAKGEYASAEFYRREADRSYRLVASARLLNPVAPVDFFVSNDGRLVTVDNWHNRGYGVVLAVYDTVGKPVSWRTSLAKKRSTEARTASHRSPGTAVRFTSTGTSGRST